MQLKVVVFVLFLVDFAVFMLVDGNGEVLGLSAGWSLVLAVGLGALLIGLGIWVAVREPRCWWWPVVFTVVNVAMFWPAICGM